MATKPTLQDWENLVQKQLKSEEIYEVLTKENIENIQIKPYYQSGSTVVEVLPKSAESTHLVSNFDEKADENVLAFMLHQNVENLSGKALFINNKELNEHLSPTEENTYFSLIDIFKDQAETAADEQLGKELLAKSFEKQICVDVALHQNAGASMAQQLALALLKAKELAEIFGTEVLKTLVFRIAIGSNYFFEIAKIRALKLVINQLSKEYDLDEIPFIFAETSLRNKAKNDAENNLIRATLELSAAMIGGADAVYSNSYLIEESTALADEISFKQQLVLAYESILNVFDDSASGSYLVEDITAQLAKNAWALFVELEEKGGYCTQIANGTIAKLIYEHAILEQQWVEEGKIKLVGVNLFPKLEQTKSLGELYHPSKIEAVRLAEMFGA